MSEALPISVFPKLVATAEGTGRITVDLPRPTRNPVYVVVEGCGAETRINFKLGLGGSYRPVNYYKPAYVQARVYRFVPSPWGLRRVVVTATAAARVRVWEILPVYDIVALKEGRYRLSNWLEPKYEETHEIDTSGMQQYDIAYESLPGLLKGYDDVDPYVQRFIELEGMSGTTQLYVTLPGRGDDRVYTPCTASLAEHTTELTGMSRITLNEGQKLRWNVPGWATIHFVVYAPGGVFRITERWGVVRAAIEPEA